MIKNPVIIKWAHETLVRAGAAYRCDAHEVVVSRGNDEAVRRAVVVGRLNPFEGLSANAAELAVLETFMALDCSCSRCQMQPGTASSAKQRTLSRGANL